MCLPDACVTATRLFCENVEESEMNGQTDSLMVAVVEDKPEDASVLESYCRQFAKEHGLTVTVSMFSSAKVFLSDYHPIYDIVFMDIGLPDLSGMEAAGQLRERDQTVTLIFVTMLVQYAVEGYAVNALDFLVKPLHYPAFKLKMQRALNHIRSKRDVQVVISQGSNLVRVSGSHIWYIEILSHNLIYHTMEGEISSYGTLKQLEGSNLGEGFARCKNCYLVNLNHVQSVTGDFVLLTSGEQLKISRSKRRDFIQALNRYLGGKA